MFLTFTLLDSKCPSGYDIYLQRSEVWQDLMKCETFCLIEKVFNVIKLDNFKFL